MIKVLIWLAIFYLALGASAAPALIVARKLSGATQNYRETLKIALSYPYIIYKIARG